MIFKVKKVITFVTAGLWKHTGGPSESVPSLLKELSLSRNFVLNLVTQDGDLSDNVQELYNYDVNIFIVKGRRFGSMHFNPAYIRVLLKLIPKSHVIHIQGIWLFPSWLASFISHLYRKKVVITPRGSLSPARLEKSKLKKQISKLLFDKRMLKNAHAIQCTSSLEERSVRDFGILKAPTYNIPNGIDLNKIVFSGETVLDEKRKIALFLSRIEPIKGIDLLLAAWKNAYKDGWVLVICGPDENNYKSQMVKLAHTLNLKEKVVFLDPIYGSNRFDLISQSQFSILPSYGENFGIVVAESLACGVPVITTQDTPWHELEEYNCGLYVETRSDAIEKALFQMTSLPKHDLLAMGAKGKNLIMQRYQWSTIARKIEGLYETL